MGAGRQIIAFSIASIACGADLQLVGSAALLQDRLRLTPSSPYTAGAAWYTEKQFVRGGFTAAFQFQMTDQQGLGPGADGFAFVLQNAGAGALGSRGSAGGFAVGDRNNRYTNGTGIPRSLAVFFDTFHNEFDPSDNFIAICTNGTVKKMRWPPARLSTTKRMPIRLKDGRIHAARITYKPPLLSVWLEESADPVLVTPVDLAAVTDDHGNAYVGFTASTGGGYQNHDILSWSLVPDSSSIMTSVDSSIQFLDKVTCMEGRNLCTPKEASVEPRDGGGYHIILPGHIQWAASIPNPKLAPVTIDNLHGYVCREDCSTAVVMKNQNGRTWFSVDKVFPNNQGFFEFDVMPGSPSQ